MDAESAKLFASLLSDLGYQVQESVYSLSYTKEEVKEYTGIEAFIECDTSNRHDIAQILEEAGITDYTINNEGITILWFGTKEEIENLKAKEKTPKVEIQEAYYTRKQVEKEKDKVFLFGDNIKDAKNNYPPRSTQAVIRGLQNAIGIPTKKTRGTREKDYFTDNDFEEAKKLIDEAIDKAVKSGKTIVIPKDGIGTGKAELAKRAPEINDYLQDQLKKLQEGKLTNKENLTEEEQELLKKARTFDAQIAKIEEQLKGKAQRKKIQSDLLDDNDRKQLYNDILNKNTNGQTSFYDSTGNGGTLSNSGKNGNTLGQQASLLSDLINEAFKNLQSFQQGQRGEDLTNDLQNGEEEYTLNTPLTPTQLARSQLDAEGDSISSEEDQAIQQQQKTFLEQINNLLTTTVLTQAQIMQFARDVGNLIIDCLNQCLSLSPKKLKNFR